VNAGAGGLDVPNIIITIIIIRQFVWRPKIF